MEYKHTKEELKFLQSQTLDRKILITQTRIQEWYQRWEGKVFVSFSGGKDSTVLLHLVRKLYPDVEAVFCDTGLEFPEIREFVKTKENVTWLKPKMTFREVIEEYGWCYPSKETALYIYYAKRGSGWAISALNGMNKDGSVSEFKQRYKKWKPLSESEFRISSKCCQIMKESPLDKFRTQSKKYSINGTTASESTRRSDSWLKTGCNSFIKGREHSKPLSFWTEQDVLEYLVRERLDYCPVYGEIVKDEKGLWKTTGEQRTGCMFCPIGCHLDKPVNKFQRMKTTHPKQWKYVIENLGLGELLDYVGVPYGKEEQNGKNVIESSKDNE